MTETKAPAGFSAWCVVELMGHVTLAGYVSEQEIAGSKLIRIDVPETDTAPAFTKMVGAGSIYGMTPVDEETVRAICVNPQRPFSSYTLQDAFDKYYKRRLQGELPDIEDRVRRQLASPETEKDDDEPMICDVWGPAHQFDAVGQCDCGALI